MTVISRSLLIPVKKTVHMTTLFCNHFDISKKHGKVINNGFFVSMGNL